MKACLFFASLIACAFAQSASIASPQAGSTLVAGSQIIVEVDQAESSSDNDEVAIIVGIANCPNSNCTDYDPSEDGLRNILYQGLFTPERDPSLPEKPAFQDFNVTIPEALGEGPSVLILVHLHAVGAVKEPVLEISTVAVDVASD